MQLLAGRYRLAEPVGRGGMAVVHRAYDEVLKRPVAVKLLSPDRYRDDSLRATVRREALAAAQLSHPNVAAVHDYGETGRLHGGRQFLVMEFVPGGTLASRLTDGGALTWPHAAEICAGVAAALAAAHARGLVHRDIKPGNIMLSPTGVKVVDFGVAAGAGQAAVGADGRLWGTAAYLSPEQLREEAVGPASDVYALGLVLHACLTGRPPWPGTTPDEVLSERRDTPTPLLPTIPSLPAEVAELHGACLARAPGQRPPADQVAQLLERATAGRSRSVAPRQEATAGAAPGTTLPLAAGSRPARASSVAVAGVLVAAVASVLTVQLALGSAPAAVAVDPLRSEPTASGCSVRYTSQLSAGGTFAAHLAVVNTGERGVANGVVAFGLPAGQRLTRVSALRWTQTRDVVRLTTAVTLAPGEGSTFSLRGTFDQQHPEAPAAFSLAGVSCDRASTRVTYALGNDERNTAGRAAGNGTAGSTGGRGGRVTSVPSAPSPTPPAPSSPGDGEATPTSSATPGNTPTPTSSATPGSTATPTSSASPSNTATPTSSATPSSTTTPSSKPDAGSSASPGAPPSGATSAADG